MFHFSSEDEAFQQAKTQEAAYGDADFHSELVAQALEMQEHSLQDGGQSCPQRIVSSAKFLGVK